MGEKFTFIECPHCKSEMHEVFYKQLTQYTYHRCIPCNDIWRRSKKDGSMRKQALPVTED